jgi:xanthine dehydrogenase accessory factor
MHQLSSIHFMSHPRDRFAIVLGTNEIASAVAVRLAWEGFCVALSHDPFPPVIRRGMAFHDALYDDRTEVDGILGLRADSALELLDVFSKAKHVAVTTSQITDLITLRTPEAIVDARMQKHRVTPDLRGVARLAVGLGPNFRVGRNCDVAIETQPAQTGEMLESGETRESDGIARELGGIGKARFLYAPRDGLWRTPLDIGARIFKGVVLGHHEGVPLFAPIDGFLRGIARDGAHAPTNAKLIEIDPRGRAANWTGTDERGRAIAAAAAQAILSAPARRFGFATLSTMAQ